MCGALHCTICYTVQGSTETAINGSQRLCTGFYRLGRVGHGEGVKIACRGFYGACRGIVGAGSLSCACARVRGRTLCGSLGRSGAAVGAGAGSGHLGTLGAVWGCLGTLCGAVRQSGGGIMHNEDRSNLVTLHSVFLYRCDWCSQVRQRRDKGKRKTHCGE